MYNCRVWSVLVLGTQPRLCSGTSEVNPSYPQSLPAPRICRAQCSAGWGGRAQHKEVDTMLGWLLLWPTVLPQPLPQSGDNSNSSNNTMAAACNNAVTLFKETANQRYLYIYSPVL